MIDNPWFELATLPKEAPWNLICLPFAGASAEYFLPWRHDLHPIGICPVQLPGRATRWQEPAFHDMDDLVEALLPHLLPMINKKPYVLFGHSMGGQIAYSLALKIQSLELPPPLCLMVSATSAPSTWGQRKKLSLLSDEEFETFFKELSGFHPEILKERSFMAMQMKLLRSDIRLCESLVAAESPQLTSPLVVFSGSTDPLVSVENMSLWQHEAAGTFRHETIEGHHFYLTEKKDKLLALIKQHVAYHYDLNCN